MPTHHLPRLVMLQAADEPEPYWVLFNRMAVVINSLIDFVDTTAARLDEMAEYDDRQDDVKVDAGPRLGLATTEEMLRELICRFRHVATNGHGDVYAGQSVDRAVQLAEMLGGLDAPTREYRTVGH